MSQPARWALAVLMLAGMVAGGTGWAGATEDVRTTGTSIAGSARPPKQGALVRRTQYGIPHILAADYHGLGYGAGYAFAEDNLCLFADAVVTLSAQRSRWFGAGATTDGVDNLHSDIYHEWVNQFGPLSRLLAEPAPIGPSSQARQLARGYAAGYNRYLADTTVARLPDPACRGAAWVRPITETDIWRRAYQVAGLTSGEAVQALIATAQPPLGTPARNRAAGAATTTVDRLRPHPGNGSNGYALGRQVTADRTGMLLANPHFPWVGEQRFYQMHLTIPGELNVSGAALAGMPVIGIGHTDRLAWTHTASTAQTFTLTRLTLTPGDPRRFLVDGRVHPMQQQTVQVTVRRPDGSLGSVRHTLHRTMDGPLIATPGLDWTNEQAYVLHDANATNLRVVDQWLAMARSRDIAGLRRAQSQVQGLPWVNTLAVDVTGTTYYGDVQVVPHVTDEVLARCQAGPRIRQVILDGSRSACGWGSDADAVAPGLFGPSRLPHLVRIDHVSNMNDSPWLANPAAPLIGYPAVVGDVGTARSARTRLGLDMIADRRDGSDGLGPAGFTLPSLQATMYRNRNLTAEQGRLAVTRICTAHPDLPGSDGKPVDVRAACSALAGWNGRGDLDGRGAVLWRRFIEVASQRGIDLWQVPFDPADPIRTPRGFAAERPALQQAFADTVREFGAASVPVDATPRDLQRYHGVSIHGCGHTEGCFNTIERDSTPSTTGPAAEVRHGSSFIMAVELTRAGPRARTILTYGQSANQSSPHHLDQTRLYSAKGWVTGRFTESEIARDPRLSVRRLNP